ncbi:MAG: hypothetical protein A4E53_02669 [Pelotomaculum sp. PtaB.Bin104]|nr:MAG: hypothetical protein A4E53_02669 [Pelotomaculum sp. PtaB.Bin104]
MSAIQQQTWDEVQVITWGDLAPHLWMDFRLALVDGVGEVEAQGVDLHTGRATVESVAEVLAQGVNVEFSIAKIENDVEITVSCSVAKKDYKNSMLKTMPTYYWQSAVIDTLLNAYTKELRRLEFNADTVRDSLFVDSVVENIDRWEQDLGITPDLSKPYDFRREKVKAKLRALGTTTKAMIQAVAAAFSNGEVEVIEYPAEYRFVVKFTGVKGIPKNMADLSAILEEIKPSHLAYSYDYTYNTWGFLVTETWGSVAGMTWEDIQTFS